MASESSFDVVSKVDMQEATNAINQAQKELEQRFDLKGTGSEIVLEKETITIKTADEMKLKNILDILESKLVKREISLRCLEYGNIESALGGTVKQVVTLKQGISKEQAKKIIGLIKDSKLKVQAQIQDDQVRVAGKNKDDLQAVMKLLRGADLDLDLQYLNFR